MNKKALDWSVYLLTDQRTASGRSLLEVVQAAIHGGATAIQLRAKEMPTREMFQLGQALHEMTQAADIPLIVNDRLDLALALEAEGIHVGQNDLPASLVRRLLGPNRIWA
jgi:thiamine-phosphate pyrophosphorylase